MTVFSGNAFIGNTFTENRKNRKRIFMIFETHAHYDDEKFKEDREQLVSSLPEQNIKRVINVGADFAGCVDSVALAEKYDYVYAAIGIHPSNIEDATEENLAWIKEKASWEKTVAIGEIGLDYYWDKEPKVQQAQREMFCRQLALAKENEPSGYHSFQRCRRGYHENYTSGAQGWHPGRHPLLFLFQGNGERICENGILHWYRRCSYL